MIPMKRASQRTDVKVDSTDNEAGLHKRCKATVLSGPHEISVYGRRIDAIGDK